jgi:hypothetical protein
VNTGAEPMDCATIGSALEVFVRYRRIMAGVVLEAESAFAVP